MKSYPELQEVYAVVQTLMHGNYSSRRQISTLLATASEILKSVVAEEYQLFPTLYARVAFLWQEKHISAECYRSVTGLLRSGKQLRKYISELPEQDVDNGYRAVLLLIRELSGIEPSSSELVAVLATQNTSESGEIADAQSKETISFTRGAVVEIVPAGDHSSPFIALETEEYGTILVELSPEWHYIIGIAELYMVVHCFRLQSKAEHWTANERSLIIVEPDYLVDATDIANQTGKHYSSAAPYLLQKFSDDTISFSMAFGSIVNYLFDEIMSGKSSTADDVIQLYFGERPFSLLALLQEEREDVIGTIRQELPLHENTIRRIAEQFTDAHISLEPSFMNPIYGIQGRLDALIEYESDSFRKEIIELKSGRAPSQTQLWENHQGQVECYNCLLDRVYKRRTGSSMMLYSRSAEAPLRNALRSPNGVKMIMHARNIIIGTERRILHDGIKVFTEISPQNIESLPTYSNPKAQELWMAVKQLSTIERAYVHYSMRCLAGENFAQRLGGGRGSGFAGLWHLSPEEKEEQFTLLAHLRLDVKASNFSTMHLQFTCSPQTQRIVNMRIGDSVIVYIHKEISLETDDVRMFSPVDGQVLKGSLREFDGEKVVVSLRNKMLAKQLFMNEGRFWAVEPDGGMSDKPLFAALTQFIKAEKHKRALILGLRSPEIAEHGEYDLPYLTSEQCTLLAKILRSNELFLLQGPPGTGKTSSMIRALAEYYYNETSVNVLLLAYTNRAADEICSALAQIQEKFPYLRFGSPGSSEHTDRLTGIIFKGHPIDKIAVFLQRTRFLVCTVSSYLNNRDISVVFRPQVAIIDEASQLLEPHLAGIIATIPKVVLIGDERQLPAVVTQEKHRLQVQHSELEQVGIRNFADSLFDRLLQRYQQQGWEHAYGMLTKQGRMNTEICSFVSKIFYNNELQVMHQHQLLPLERAITDESTVSELQKRLARERMLFVPTESIQGERIHRQEAEYTAIIVQELIRLQVQPHEIGIITPFRAQIAAIYSALPKELRSQITVDTVERYQGSAREVIIISCAVHRRSQLQSLQSLNAEGTVDKKLNVALTRAKQQLIVLGNEEALSVSVHYRELIEHIRLHNGVLSAEELRL